MKKKKNKITKHELVGYIILFICIVLVVSIDWLVTKFGGTDFEQYLYMLIAPAEGTSVDTVILYIKNCIPIIFVIFGTIVFFYREIIVLSKDKKVDLEIVIRDKKHKFKLRGIHFIEKHIVFIMLIALIICSIYSANKIGFVDFLKNYNDYTMIYENFYVEPRDEILTVPENKRNLIIIYLESMESTFASIEHGGDMEEDLIEPLYKISTSNDSQTFSINDKQLGGAVMMPGTGFTSAALVSTSSGIPLGLKLNTDNINIFTNFFPGIRTIGDVLNANGYNQMFMIGSAATFGNREAFYTQHGSYIIKDYPYAKRYEWIPEDYWVWWGYEDSKLFSFAKEEITELSKGDKPFNFTMLTVDTHFVGGYLDKSCKIPFDDQYKNVINCSSEMVYEFVNWIKEQPFYKNTTIVIMGDHTTMDQDWVYRNTNISKDNYTRTTYNCFINSTKNAINLHNRNFTSMDMYPTILSSIGFEIDGNRLGIGTDLFSESRTVLEEVGYDYMYNELNKRSKYYNNRFIYNK